MIARSIRTMNREGGAEKARFSNRFVSIVLAFLLALSMISIMPPAQALALDGPIQDSYNSESATGSSDNPYKILVTDMTNQTRPSAFWSGTGVNAVGGTDAITPFAVTFEQREGDKVEGDLISSMTFDMHTGIHEGVPTYGPLFDESTVVWDFKNPSWTYAFRLSPYSAQDTSTGDLRIAFAWHGCFATYFDDWSYSFDAVKATAGLEADKQIKPGDIVTLTYYGAYDVNQTSRGTAYSTDFSNQTTANESSSYTVLGGPTSEYSVEGVVDADGFVTFEGDNAIKYGGNYTVSSRAGTKYVDYSSYDPYQGAQGATVGGRDGNETFTLTMINPLSQGVTASSGESSDQVTIVTDPLAYEPDAEDGSTPAYYYNLIVNPQDSTQDIVFGFDFYGPGGNWVSAENNSQYIHVYTTADKTKWSEDTCVWSANGSNTTASNPLRWTGYYETTIPAGTLQAGKTYYYVISNGIYTSAGNRFLNADVVFEFSTDMNIVPTWGGGSGDAIISYNGSQGKASTVTMATPSAGFIKTNYTRSVDYNCWYNIIDGTYSIDAAKDNAFALELEGGGSKHQNQASWQTNNLPYIEVYKNLNLNPATDEADASVTFNASDLVASWKADGSGNLVVPEDADAYLSGNAVPITIPAGTLEAGTTYYFVVGAGFSVSGADVDGIGQPAIFEFTTNEDESNYAAYAAQGNMATMQLKAISGDEDGSILSGIVNDTAKNVVVDGKTTLFFNRIQTPLEFEEGLSFTYQMAGGGSNWVTLDSAAYGKIHIYSDEALTKEVYALANEDCAQDATTKTLFTATVPASALAGNTTYYIAFENLANREDATATRATEATIVFKFKTVPASNPDGVDKSQLKASITTAQAVLDAAVVGTEDGQYPQEAVDELQAAIDTAQAAYDGNDLTSAALVRKAAQVLDSAVEDFYEQRNFSILSIAIEGIPESIEAGDGGKVTATVTSSPQDDRYNGVLWSASDNITIDANTGTWASTTWGDGWIKATSIKDPDVSTKVNLTINEPVADYAFSYTYDETNKTATVSGFTCNNKVAIDVVVPSTVEYNGETYTVTALADGMYASGVFGAYGSSTVSLVRTVTLPSTVKYVGAYAFRYLNNLKTVDLGGTETLGVAAFSNCGIETVEFPETLKSMGGSDFSGCLNLKTVTGMKGLTEIPSNGFASCSLEEIDIPENVTTIGSSAFSADTKLKSVTGMAGVTTVGTNAFNQCTSLTSFDIPASMTSIPASMFMSCSGLESVTVPASIQTIEGYAFYNCSSLREVIFDTHESDVPTVATAAFGQTEGVTIVGYNSADAVRKIAEDNNADAKNYTCGANFTYLNRSYEFTYSINEADEGSAPSVTVTGVKCVDESISECDIVIPSSVYIDGVTYAVTVIGESSFKNSPDFRRIHSVTVPASIVKVESEAFGSLPGLGNITFESVSPDVPVFASDSFSGVNGTIVNCYDAAETAVALAEDNAGAQPGVNGGTHFVRNSLTKSVADLEISAPEQSATGSALDPVVIVDGDYVLVEGVDYVVEYANNVEIGTASYTVKGINRYDGEASGTFEILKYVLGYEFDDQAKTAKVVSYTYKGADMVDIEVPATVERNGEQYAVTSIADGAAMNSGVFYDPMLKIRSVKLPESVTYVGSYAFQGCSRMTSVEVPGVTEFGNAVFMSCSGLTSFDIDEKVTKIGSQMFYACYGLKSVTGMEGLTELPDHAFNQCGFDSIYIPDNITKLGNGVFSGSYVTEVTGLAGITELPYYTFGGCYYLEHFDVPDGITTLGRQVFYCASKLKSVTIPASVTTIDAYAFYYAPLEEITFLTEAADVPTFGASAFGMCDGVTVYGNESAEAVKAMVEANSGAVVSYLNGANFKFVSFEQAEQAPAVLAEAAKSADQLVASVVESADGTDITPDKQWATAESIEALNAAIAAANELLASEDAGYWDIQAALEQVEAAREALQPAAGTMAYANDVQTLTSVVVSARTTSVGITPSSDGTDVTSDAKWVSADAAAALDAAIEASNAALSAVPPQHADVQAAFAALQSALDAYKPAVGTKATDTAASSLSASVSAAKALISDVVESADGSDVPEGTQWATAERIAAVNAAIATANEALSAQNPQAAAVDAAATGLAKAVSEFASQGGTLAGTTAVAELSSAASSAKISAAAVAASADGTDILQSELWVAPEVRAALLSAAEAAQNVASANNPQAADVNAAAKALSEALAAFDPQPGTKAASAQVDELASALAEAQALTEGVVVSEDGSDVADGEPWVTPEADEALASAIAQAQAVIAAENPQAEAVEAALAALAEAEAGYVPAAGTHGTWIYGSNGWWFRHADGSWTANGWELIDDVWYLFDADGWMLIGWQKWNGSWYYLQPSGAMLTGWLSWGGEWYYLTDSGAMATGWFQDATGTWYFADASGAMLSNCWVGDYYLTGSGAMATSQWIGAYYVGADGKWVPNA